MLFRRIILTWILTSGTFSSALMAQITSVDSWLRVHDVKRANGWLNSENASGLVTLGVSQVAEIILNSRMKWGDLHDYYDSDNAYTIGLIASSYYRLSPKVVVNGRAAYSHRTLKDATGSYFIDPTQTPFDLVEFTTEHPGDKLYERYNVAGGVGANLNRWFSLGASLDYTAANYAKRKDLRHTNSLLDMTVTTGIAFHLSKRLSAGVNYTYRRRNESLLLSIYGKTDQIYASLINYGAFFGKRETFGEVGYTKENESKPLFDEYHGGALQVNWRITPRLTFFNELGYRKRSGYYGDPSPSTVVYAEHDGLQGHYTGIFNYHATRQTHTLQLRAETYEVDNEENIYTYENEETGRSYINYLGSREIGSRSEHGFSLLYTGAFDVRENLPRWQLTLGGSYNQRDIKASNYPDFRHQELSWWHVDAMLERNVRYKQNCYTILVGSGYGNGGGDASTDGIYGSDGSAETLTRTLDALLMQEYEYRTASRCKLNVKLSITRALGQKGLKGYLSLDYMLQKAFHTTYSGNACRQGMALGVGCLF